MHSGSIEAFKVYLADVVDCKGMHLLLCYCPFNINDLQLIPEPICSQYRLTIERLYQFTSSHYLSLQQACSEIRLHLYEHQFYKWMTTYLISHYLKAFLIQFRFQLKAIVLSQLTTVGACLKKPCWDVWGFPSTAHPLTQHALLLRFITLANSNRAERSPGIKHMCGSACSLAHISSILYITQ